tara:strand:+ start:16772 stop:18235 length:1464 start_codon:yes stop_codon:yes gene_type:complete
MLERIKAFVGKRPAKKSSPNYRVSSGNAAPTTQDPTPLPHAVPPKVTYPIEELSPGLRNAAEAIVRMTKAPEAIAAQSVLSVASLTVASRAKVQTLGSPANAASYFLCIALSGERKSAADRIAMGGVDKMVMQIREEHEVAVSDYDAKVADLGRGAEKPVRPRCPNFLVTEPTIEGAFKAISSGVGFLGWLTDEAAAFFGGHSMSKDQRAKTSGILSKLWDGAYFFRPRATQDGDGYVPPTATTLSLMFQPILIRETYGDELLIGQGILARVLPSWPQSNMGGRKYQFVSEEDRAVATNFQEKTAEALVATLADSTERVLTLSQDALSTCIKFHDDIEAELSPGGWAADISSFASKAPEHACRLSAIMTLFEDPKAETISAEVMQSSCAIVKYHLQQFRYLCIAATNETEIVLAQTLLDWLRRHVAPGDAFARDRILQAGPVPTRRAKALDRALAILMQHDWINELPKDTEVDGKKRKKAYQLNPAA